MYVPQLTGFEPYPSAHVGEISYIWSFWGPFLLIPIQKRSYFKWLLRKTCLKCRAGEELKELECHKWGSKKKNYFFRPDVTFEVDAQWLLNRCKDGKKILRDRPSGSRFPPFRV